MTHPHEPAVDAEVAAQPLDVAHQVRQWCSPRGRRSVRTRGVCSDRSSAGRTAPPCRAQGRTIAGIRARSPSPGRRAAPRPACHRGCPRCSTRSDGRRRRRACRRRKPKEPGRPRPRRCQIYRGALARVAELADAEGLNPSASDGSVRVRSPPRARTYSCERRTGYVPWVTTGSDRSPTVNPMRSTSRCHRADGARGRRLPGRRLVRGGEQPVRPQGDRRARRRPILVGPAALAVRDRWPLTASSRRGRRLRVHRARVSVRPGLPEHGRRALRRGPLRRRRRPGSSRAWGTSGSSSQTRSIPRPRTASGGCTSRWSQDGCCSCSPSQRWSGCDASRAPSGSAVGRTSSAGAGEQRLRLAQELHDVVAHNISLINVQAGVALHLAGREPEQAGPGPRDHQAGEPARRSTSCAASSTCCAAARRAAPRAPAPRPAELEPLVDGVRAERARGASSSADGAAAAAGRGRARGVPDRAGGADQRHPPRPGPARRRSASPSDDGRSTVEVDRRRRSAATADRRATASRACASGPPRSGGTVEAGPRPGGGFRSSTCPPPDGGARDPGRCSPTTRRWCGPGSAPLLDAEADIEVVGEAADGDEAVAPRARAPARRRAHGHPHARRRRPGGDPPDRRRRPRLAGVAGRRSSRRSTSTSTSSRRSGPAPAGSWSRTPSRPSCCAPCGPSPPATRCSRPA